MTKIGRIQKLALRIENANHILALLLTIMALFLTYILPKKVI